MKNNHKLITMLAVMLLCASYNFQAIAGQGHEHEESEDHKEEESHNEEATISHNAAEELGIKVEQAAEGVITQSLNVTGRVTLNQNSTAQVKARFSGVIRTVEKEPGEMVKSGDTLATVESNDSLQVYPVKAPVSGTIITRNANIGEIAGDAPLFVIADLSQLWAELFVFSKDGEKLKTGQKVRIQCLDDPIHTESVISLILPTAEASSQTVIARAVIDNKDAHWRSGMNIRADIITSETTVPLVVRTDAIQRMEGKQVVFIVQEGGKYKAQAIETGLSDHEWTEVKSGLTAGESYVAQNSFIIKADIGKSGAEHEH